MPIEDKIKKYLIKHILSRLSTRGKIYDRAWLRSDYYTFDTYESNSPELMTKLSIRLVHSPDKVYAYDDEELTEYVDEICEKLEEAMLEELNKIKAKHLIYVEGKTSLDIRYRYIDIGFKYRFIDVT